MHWNKWMKYSERLPKNLKSSPISVLLLKKYFLFLFWWPPKLKSIPSFPLGLQSSSINMFTGLPWISNPAVPVVCTFTSPSGLSEPFFPVWLLSQPLTPHSPCNCALGLDSGLICHVSRGDFRGMVWPVSKWSYKLLLVVYKQTRYSLE